MDNFWSIIWVVVFVAYVVVLRDVLNDLFSATELSGWQKVVVGHSVGPHAVPDGPGVRHRPHGRGMTGRMMAAHQASGGGPWLVGGLMIRPESKYSGRDETDRPRNIARPNIHRRPARTLLKDARAARPRRPHLT